MVLTGETGEFRRVAVDLHRRLSEFVHRVVVHRRDKSMRWWRHWLREDPHIHTHKWLRPDMVLPAPFSSV